MEAISDADAFIMLPLKKKEGQIKTKPKTNIVKLYFHVNQGIFKWVGVGLE